MADGPITAPVDSSGHSTQAPVGPVGSQGASSVSQPTPHVGPDIPVASEDVKHLQTWLHAAGFWPGNIDGQWSDVLSTQLQHWQSSVGIDATGQYDAATKTKIDDIGRYLASATPPAAATAAPGAPVGSAAASGGVTSPVSTTAVTSDLGGTPNPDGLFGIPGGAKIWEVDGKDWYAVYTVPGTGTPLAWKIDAADLPAIFGPGKTPVADRQLTGAEAFSQGPLVFGSSRMLANTSEHPFDAFVANFQTEASTRPWLRDPEILALTTRALLENRTVTDAELAGTKWWQTHTAGERAWISEYNSDPATAKQQIQDSRDKVRQTMLSAGVANAPDSLVNLIADRVTGGTWTQAYANTQITKIADPMSPGNLDPTVGQWVSDLSSKGTTLNTLTDNTSDVDQLVLQGLGPAFAGTWTKQQKEMWAGRIRNDPQAKQELVDELKRQRLALYPEYKDPNLTYEDIAAPWRGVWTQTWGQQPDETDPLFTQIVRTNDLASAQQTLRTEGLKRGNATVAQSMLAAVGQSDLGGSVRRMV